MTARLATTADLPAVGRSLASAFDDDPVWRWLLTDERTFTRRATKVLECVATMHLGHDTVWVTDDGEAAGIWSPPKRYKVTPREFLPVAHRFVPAAGLSALRRFASMAPVEKLHPPEPHWYLAVLGTDRAHQGKGLGSAVMAPAMARADEEGIGCYLESSKESNIPFYARHGFEVTGTHDLDKGKGPRIWLMWRDPRPPGG